MSLTNERRKRLRKPIKLTLVGSFLIIEPFLQVWILSIYKDMRIISILSKFGNIQLFLWILPLICGIGLLLVKKWGWYLFILYSIILTGFNIYALTIKRNTYNYIAFSETIISFLIILYIIREDISAPYFKMYPRGFRGEKRNPVKDRVTVNGIEKITRDRSSSGFYVDWTQPELHLNQEVEVFFPEDKKPEKRKAGVVRIDETGVGIAFRE